MANTLPRVASSIDLSQPLGFQRPASVVVTLSRPVQFTKEQVTNPEFLTKQLTAMHQELAQNSHAQRSHPEQAPMTFHNVVCGTSGAKVVLPHGFNRHVDYLIVNWKSAPLPASATVTLYNLVCDEEEASTTRQTSTTVLALNSWVAGVATIRVFPRA